jgi:D-arginine dehydrogenase
VLNLRSVQTAWAGLRTFAPDRIPVAGPDPAAPGLWWIAGQGGYGIQIAPELARVTAASVRGAAVPAALSVARFTGR